MDRGYWIKQAADKPLYPELLWSRPENRMHAGKLLIIGGNAHGFAAPAEAYGEAMRAGAGTVRAILPEAIRKIVGIIIENADFAPSTPSGSFSKRSLSDFLEQAAWADSVLLAGDLGRNSETAIVIESLLQKTTIATTITRDAVDYVTATPLSIAHRQNTTLVLSLSQLQRLGIALGFEQPISFSMDLLKLVEWLHEYTNRFAPHIIVKYLDTIFIAVNGQVITTKDPHKAPIWRLRCAAYSSVWWMQNPAKPLQALATAVHETVL